VNNWNSVLELAADRSVVAGSREALRDAIGAGADLRIYTEFRYNEHIDPESDNSELVTEVSDFRVTYLVDEERWAAGIMSLRMPIQPPDGFGPRPSMSFFMYNENGEQAIARPHLDGNTAEAPLPTDSSGTGTSTSQGSFNMPRYHQFDSWDAATNAPSHNFVYDFESYRFIVRGDWQEVLAHSAGGEVVSGSLEALIDAFSAGREIKVGIGQLCDDLSEEQTEHEVFVHAGPGYYCTERKLFTVGTQPVVRVRPDVPMRYHSGGWDFGWLMPRSDGFLALWLCDPYTLEFRKVEKRCPVRWFVR